METNAAHGSRPTSSVSFETLHVALSDAPRHVIEPGPAGIARLDRAPEAWLALDLQLPDGDPRPLQLVFEGGVVGTVNFN